MEGRTIVRPDQDAYDDYNRRYSPSMEGRTIVRPDSHYGWIDNQQYASFNGGPDNRPARHQLTFPGAHNPCNLQWRAGQSSGQTCDRRCLLQVVCTLQWRAGQSSGQTACGNGSPPDGVCLQWRAGQSSGQTHAKHDIRYLRLRPSMEGRTIVRPDGSSNVRA